jgi:hypothetical protein
VTWSTDLGGKGGLADHLRLDGSELGAGPAGGLRLEFGRSRIYNLRFAYRRTEHFSALTDFANPFFPDVIPGQHTLDRVRNMYDAELELFPGAVVTPILGYTRNVYSGPGRTTYHVGQDEFQLTSDRTDTDQEYRVGAGLNAGFLTGRFVQGWREFKATDSLFLAPGANNGNNSGTVLGVPVNLTDFNRTTSTKTNTPTTSAYVSARLGPAIRLIGSYQRAKAESNTNDAETLAGKLVSFELSRFFNGFSETDSTRAKATFWTGSGRLEVAVADGADVSAGYSRRHRYLDGFALVSSLFTDTTNFAGGDPQKTIKVLLEANNAMDRFDDVFDVNVQFRGLGPVALRAGWSDTKQDVTVTPDLSEIVVAGNQGGSFGRRIDSWTGGASFSRAGFTLGADYQGDHASQPIVRTDYLDRNRYRVRLSWAAELVRVAFNGQQTDSSNDQPGINYDTRYREYGGELEITPVKPLRLRFSASKYDAKTSIPYRDPEDFSVAVSEHRESGLSLEGGLGLVIGEFRLDGTYIRFTNKGSYPFTIDRARIGGEVPVRPGFALVAEWLRDKYNDVAQNTGSLGKYDANRYGIYVRLTPF